MTQGGLWTLKQSFKKILTFLFKAIWICISTWRREIQILPGSVDGINRGRSSFLCFLGSLLEVLWTFAWASKSWMGSSLPRASGCFKGQHRHGPTLHGVWRSSSRGTWITRPDAVVPLWLWILVGPYHITPFSPAQPDSLKHSSDLWAFCNDSA